MLSRVAERLYWLGRYLERAESAARLVHVDYYTSIEGGAPAGVLPGHMWDALIGATGAEQAFARAREADPALAPADFLVLSPDNPNSIRSTVAQARFLARGLREHISREVWEEINTLHLALQSQRALVESDLYDLCTVVKRSIETLFGLYDNTVLFDEGREWFRCGLYLERADMTSRILDSKYHMLLPAAFEVGGPLDRFQWAAILRSASAWQAFRKVGHADISGPRVTEMLILEPAFPRSLHFCVIALQRHYDRAAAETPPRQRLHAQRLVAVLALDLDALTIDQVIAHGLHEFLDDFQARLVRIDNAITDHVFRALPDAEAAG